MSFVHIVNRHKYILCPLVQPSFEGAYFLKGCDMYKPNGQYVGFWDVWNMPQELKHVLLKFTLELMPTATISPIPDPSYKTTFPVYDRLGVRRLPIYRRPVE
jgi:hypothetical protein